jgi:hypothetical protein
LGLGGAYVLNIRYRNYWTKALGCTLTDTNNWPRCIQIAWQLHDDMGKLVEQDYLVKPDGFNTYDAERIHGISTELAAENGISRKFWRNSMWHWVLNSL